MSIFYRLFLVFLAAATNSVFAQKYPGYTLIAPQGSSTISLVDTNGNEFHRWYNLSGSTGYSCYLMPNQVLLRTVQYQGNAFFGGGQTGIVQKIDWNGNLIWNYQYSTSTYSMHHDVCPMPNGNVLLISYETKTAAEVAAAGCSKNTSMWPEKIVEIKPSGATGGNVVWEWHVWDHLCQDKFPSKANYVSSIVNNPQLVDVNRSTSKDWMHANGIDYNAQLDQIVFSSHNLNEIYVIDHSTTSIEAASHRGGRSGKGGDILYRWGNPTNYGANGSKIYNVVHNAHWVPQDCPNAGFIAAFNNGATPQYSGCDYINPPISGYNYTITQGSAFEPSAFNYRKLAGGKTSNMGSVQEFPNGNVLICVALSGRLYEYSADGSLVWSYSAGSILPTAMKYSADYVNGSNSMQTLIASASPQSVCSGDIVQLSSTLTGGTGYAYSWSSKPAGFTSTEQSPVARPTENTIYTVTATKGASTLVKSVAVTVKSTPAVPIISGKFTAQRNSVEQYSITAVNGANYQWSAIGGNVTSGKNSFVATVVWQSSDSGAISVIVSNSNGCNVSSSQRVLLSGKVFSLDKDTIYSVAGGSLQNLKLSSSGDWAANSNQSWVETTPKTGTSDAIINVKVLPNSGEKRNATVTISSGAFSKYLTIIQYAPVKTPKRRFVKFTVDMSKQTVNSTGVHISGDFQAAAGFSGGDWQPNTTPMLKENTSSYYSTVVNLPVNAKYEYKFLNGDQFYDSEFVPEESRVNNDIDNRWFAADSTLGDTIYVGPILYGGNAPQGKYLVRFRIDMQNSQSISPNGVHVAGNFQEADHQWDAMRNIMYSFDDDLYEAIAYVNPNASIAYKFYNGYSPADAESVPANCSENGSRVIIVKSDTVLAKICFESCDLCGLNDVKTESYSEAKVYPNPFDNNVTIQIPTGKYSLVATDAFGRELWAQPLCLGGRIIMNIQWPASGIYFLRITDHAANNIHTIPLLRQN